MRHLSCQSRAEVSEIRLEYRYLALLRHRESAGASRTCLSELGARQHHLREDR